MGLLVVWPTFALAQLDTDVFVVATREVVVYAFLGYPGCQMLLFLEANQMISLSALSEKTNGLRSWYISFVLLKENTPFPKVGIRPYQLTNRSFQAFSKYQNKS